MIYFWDNEEPAYDGHDVFIVESDAPVEDVLALLNAKGHVIAMAEAALTSYRWPLEKLWKTSFWIGHPGCHEVDGYVECPALEDSDHAACNCVSRPIVNAAIKLGLVKGKVGT